MAIDNVCNPVLEAVPSAVGVNGRVLDALEHPAKGQTPRTESAAGRL